MAELNSTLRHTGATIADFARRSGLVGFWRWWSAELSPLVPERARTAVARHRLRPVLALQGDTAVLWRPAAQGEAFGLVEAAHIGLAGDVNAVAAAGRAALANLAPSVYGGASAVPRIVIALAPQQVLRKTLTLPAAIEENLKATLGYDLDRLTPFKADELYFDAAVMERNPAKGEVRVDFASARRAVVDQALTVAESFGVEVAAVVPVAPQAASSSRLNLLPDDRRRRSLVFARWQFWLPLALLALLAATAVILPLWQKRDYAIAVMKQAEQARGLALESDRLRTDLERQAGDYNFALGRKYAFPGTAQVLDEMSRLLPDDTWLTQLEIKTTARGKDPTRELLMRGESQNAGKLISLLEDAKLVGQAAPRSPTTKVQPGPGEVFDIGAQLKTLPPPATIPLGGMVAAAAPATPVPAAPAAPAPATVAEAPPAAAGSVPAAGTAPGAGTAPAQGAVTPPAGAAPSPPGIASQSGVAPPAAAPAPQSSPGIAPNPASPVPVRPRFSTSGSGPSIMPPVSEPLPPGSAR